MNFEYLQTIRKESSIDINEPGESSLQAFNDEGLEYYMQISTSLGFSRVKSFGPFKGEEQDSYFNYTTYELEYNEKKIYKIINDFLNGKNPKTQVFEISKDEFNDKLKAVKL